MRNLNRTSILLAFAFLLQTGCAAGVAVRPPVVLAPAPIPGPMPRPLPPPPPPPPVRLSQAEAISMGQQWCEMNGYGCWVKEADLVHGGDVWRVKYDAVRPGGYDHPGKGKGHWKGKGKGHFKHHHDHDEERGELRLEFDAWNGELIRVDARS